jgi:hypothetical protein
MKNQNCDSCIHQTVCFLNLEIENIINNNPRFYFTISESNCDYYEKRLK